MKIGFVGSHSGMTLAQRETLRNELINLEAKTLIHGDALESDPEAHVIGQKLALDIIKYPSNVYDKRAFTEGGVLAAAPADFPKRNKMIVEACDYFIIAPKKDSEEARSEAWVSFRHAMRNLVPRALILRDGSIQRSYQKVWLDSVRQPVIGWEWYKSAADTIASLQRQVVQELSLDYDLKENYGTGYDVLQFIKSEMIRDGYMPPRDIRIHAVDQVKRAKMLQIVDSIEDMRKQKLRFTNSNKLS